MLQVIQNLQFLEVVIGSKTRNRLIYIVLIYTCKWFRESRPTCTCTQEPPYASTLRGAARERAPMFEMRAKPFFRSPIMERRIYWKH